MAGLGASALLEWGGSGAPATLFGWDRLVGAGGPEVAVLHSPALCAARVCTALLAKGPYGSLGRLVRPTDRASFESRPLASLLFLARSSWVGEKEEGAKRFKFPVLCRGGGALGLLAVGFRSLAAPGGLHGTLAWCVSRVVVVGLA